MIRDNRVVMGLPLAIAAALLVAGCGAPAATPPAEQAPSASPEAAPNASPEAAPDAGAQLVETKCSLCHPLDRVTSAQYDKAGWEETVTRMEKNGLVVTPEEKQAIIDSLSAE